MAAIVMAATASTTTAASSSTTTAPPPAVIAYKQRPEWQKSEECKRCGMKFSSLSLLNSQGRHHCRNCGQSFCQACSSLKIALPHFGLLQPERVCVPCYNTTVKQIAVSAVAPFSTSDSTAAVTSSPTTAASSLLSTTTTTATTTTSSSAVAAANPNISAASRRQPKNHDSKLHPPES